MTSQATQPSAPAAKASAGTCDRCGRPLKRVRYELYANRRDRDEVQQQRGAHPVKIIPSTYVGTYGGACYYSVFGQRQSLGQLCFRRVVRVEVG